MAHHIVLWWKETLSRPKYQLNRREAEKKMYNEADFHPSDLDY